MHQPDESVAGLSNGALSRRALVAAGCVGAVCLVGWSAWPPAREKSGTAALGDEGLQTVTDVAIPSGQVPLGLPFSCVGPRLPSSITQRWSAGLPGVRSIDSRLVVSDRVVVAVVGTDTPDAEIAAPTEALGLDIETGAVLWRVGLGLGAADRSVLGIVDGVVLIELVHPETAMHQVLAVDEATGAELWTFDSTQPAEAFVEHGTLLLQRRQLGTAPVLFQVGLIDPASGRERWTMDGTLVGVLPDGMVVTWAGHKVLGGLADAVERSTTMLGAATPGEAFAASVDGVFRSDASGRLVRSVRGGTPEEIRLVGSDEIATPGIVSGAAVVGPDELVVEGDGNVFGALFKGGPYVLRWSVAGTVVESMQSDRWMLLRVARPDGSQRIIDASTGATVAEIPDVAGWEAAFSMLANGAIVLSREGASAERQAFGLDGGLLWSLPGSGSLAVGDGVVIEIDARSDPAGVGSEPTRLVAYSGPTEPCAPASSAPPES